MKPNLTSLAQSLNQLTRTLGINFDRFGYITLNGVITRASHFLGLRATLYTDRKKIKRLKKVVIDAKIQPDLRLKQLQVALLTRRTVIVNFEPENCA